jgi:O-antigen/teichoic acid export membrane protein
VILRRPKCTIELLPRLISLFRLRAFDANSEERRSRERYKRATLNMLAAAAARGVAVCTAVISVPLTLHYLGAERYGMWMTLSSLIAMMSFADFGLGNGLLNSLAEANGTNDTIRARRAVSTAFFLLLGIATCLVLATLLISKFISWAQVFNVTDSRAALESGPSVTVFILFFALGLPLGILQRIQMAYQEGFANSLWQTLGNLFGLLGLVVAIRAAVGLPVLVASISAGPVMASILNWRSVFRVHHSALRPKWAHFDICCVRSLAAVGGVFFLMQIFGSIALSTDNIIIAQALGPKSVATYSLITRAFSIVAIVPMLFVSQLWPAYGEAYARGDLKWIRRTVYTTLWVNFILVTLISIIMLIFGKALLRLWVGPSIQFPLALSIPIACSTIVITSSHAIGIFLLGINKLRFSLVAMLLLAPVTLLSKLYLVGKVGLLGVAWATAIPYFAINTVPALIYTLYVLKTMTSVKQQPSGTNSEAPVTTQPEATMHS